MDEVELHWSNQLFPLLNISTFYNIFSITTVYMLEVVQKWTIYTAFLPMNQGIVDWQDQSSLR